MITGIRGLMPVVTPRLTGHNAQRWSGIIGAGVVENKGFKGIYLSKHHSVPTYQDRVAHDGTRGVQVCRDPNPGFGSLHARNGR